MDFKKLAADYPNAINGHEPRQKMFEVFHRFGFYRHTSKTCKKKSRVPEKV